MASARMFRPVLPKLKSHKSSTQAGFGRGRFWVAVLLKRRQIDDSHHIMGQHILGGKTYLWQTAQPNIVGFHLPYHEIAVRPATQYHGRQVSV
jgi:hypothetical protein